MIASFILGIVVGLAAGVLATIRQYEKHLKTANEQCKRLSEALGKATTQQLVLTASLNAANTLLKKS